MSIPSIIRKAVIAVVAAVALAETSFAQGPEPANKPAVAINRGAYAFVANGQTVRILQEVVKTSSPADLRRAVTAESSILTQGVTTGNTTSFADGTIRVTLTIDGQVVHPTGGTTAPGHQRDGDTAAVVFANQTHSRTTSGFFADPGATINDYIQTKHASGFNWAVLNVGAGTHTIEVFATYSEATAGNGNAQGIIGNRSLVVQPVNCQVNETVVDGSQVTTPVVPISLN